MIRVASLVGLSYSGKSTLAEGVVMRLQTEGVSADIIKKDEALKTLGRERYGEDDNSGGYSVWNFLKGNSIPSADQHRWINEQIRVSMELGNLAILEGGTRTRSSQAQTLEGLDLSEEEFRIFLMDIPFRVVLQRARERRKVSGRYDDSLIVASAKLIGQTHKSRSKDAPQATDADVTVIDAQQHPDVMADTVVAHILASRDEK